MVSLLNALLMAKFRISLRWSIHTKSQNHKPATLESYANLAISIGILGIYESTIIT